MLLPGPKIREKRYWQLVRDAEVDRRRRENRGAVGAENVGCGEGLSPSPLEEGSGEEAVPPPEKNFDFASQSGDF